MQQGESPNHSQLMKLLPLLLAASALAASLTGQAPIVEQPQYGTVNADPVGVQGPGMPAAPEGFQPSIPKHGMPPVPVAFNNRPQPNSPEVVELGEGVDVGGTYKVFSNPNVKPSNTSTSRIGEPDVALADSNNGFLTGNWHASRTKDGGGSWTRVNPYTKFAASYGGFCCDQRITSRSGMTCWLLQYSKNSNGNIQRIAVAKTAADLGNGNFFKSWSFSPTNFGYTAGYWLDYPDSIASDNYFYFTSNVYNQSNKYQGSVIWRLKRSELLAGGTVSYSYIDSAAGVRGSSFRMTRGAKDQVMIASHKDTSTLRLIRWNDTASGFSTVERTIASWTRGHTPAPGPDGKDWTGRADNRITGGFISDTEFGFAWHVNAQGTHPHSYTKLVRFNLDQSLKSERDIWSSTRAAMYPALVSNAWGHVAAIVAWGGGTQYPSSATLLDDEFETFSTARIFATGNSGPNTNDWGDYFTVSKHPSSSQYGTFYGSGMRLSGGGANSNSIPEMVHFGREAYGPNYVALIVTSTGTSGIPIALTKDAFVQGSGDTPFLRAYTNNTNYTAIAPATHSSRTGQFLFERWASKSVATPNWSLRPLGTRTFSTTIGSIDDAIEARYIRARVLTVKSEFPSSVTITVSPNDFNGLGSGKSTFTRTYYDGEVVTLTAGAKIICNDFKRWVVNGTNQTLGRRTITVTMSAAKTATAQFYDTATGSIKALGAGCRGSNGLVPVHTVSQPNGVCGPQQGTTTTFAVKSAPAGAPVVMNIGLSSTIWNGIRLPFDLSLIGMNGCLLRQNMILSINGRTDGFGSYNTGIKFPVTPASVGVAYHTQFTIIDLKSNALGITVSNAMTTRLGGRR